MMLKVPSQGFHALEKSIYCITKPVDFLLCKAQTALKTKIRIDLMIFTVLKSKKVRWLQRDLNLLLWVSRPPLYPLSYLVKSDWWRDLSHLSARHIFAVT